MRSLVVLFLLVFCFSGFGQIINFPDPNFKNALVNTKCVDNDFDGTGERDADINNDGEIEASEALQIVGLKVQQLNIKNLEGIRFFENLSRLNCAYNEIETLDVSGMKNLNDLVCGINQISSINLQGLDNLTSLSISQNNLSDTLKINGLPNLKYLYCDGNGLNHIEIDMPDSLNRLDCQGNSLNSLDVSLFLNLTWLNCTRTNLKELDVKNLKKLARLSCGYNNIEHLDVSNQTNLIELFCSSNNLITLNVKNGRKITDLSFGNNNDLKYICCNENETDFVRNKANSYGIFDCEINSYCSFNPGGKFYILKGENKLDIKNNDCNGEYVKIPNQKFTISNGIQHGIFISNNSGKFTIPLQEGSHTVTPVFENNDHFEANPEIVNVSFPNSKDTVTQNFCIKTKETFQKINITIIPLSPPARPGFDAQYKIMWENKGNLLENGTIHFTYDENIFDYVKSTLSPDALNSGKLSWDYTDLLPFEKREIIVTLNLNSPMENPPVNAGDITYLYANILDNVFRLENVIVGSYDPNDKTCLQGQYFHPDSVGKFVDFLIRFENTGNYAAENVVIKDIIDDKVFDVSSLQITDASHEMYTRIAGNKVEFIFENIQLPFEDEFNDGYVAFKIKTKSTLKLGDEMKNLADIYFDYNFPIRTNETQTTIAIPSGTKDIQTEVAIHPNPVRDVLTLDSSTRWTKAEIFDIAGRLIKVTCVDGYSVDVTGLDSGTYILHLSEKDKRGRVKFVKM